MTSTDWINKYEKIVLARIKGDSRHLGPLTPMEEYEFFAHIHSLGIKGLVAYAKLQLCGPHDPLHPCKVQELFSALRCVSYLKTPTLAEKLTSVDLKL